MAVWFARKSSVNINAANVWNSAADGSGSWLTWPPANNDVLMANGYTSIVFNVNASVAQIRTDTANGAAAGGSFQYTTSGVSVTGTLYAGSSVNYAVYIGNGGTYYWVGDVYAGSGSSWRGIMIDAGSVTLHVTGNVYGGSGSNAHAIDVVRAGSTCNLTGTATGGTGAAACGIFNTNTGTVNLTGTATGGAGPTADGARNFSTGTVTVIGNAIAATAAGLRNGAGGTSTVTGYTQASATESGAINAAQGILEVGETRSASNGFGAVTGAFRYASASALIHKPIAADGSTLTMKPVSAFTLPVEATVRNGVSYGADKVGTLAGCNRHHRMSI